MNLQITFGSLIKDYFTPTSKQLLSAMKDKMTNTLSESTVFHLTIQYKVNSSLSPFSIFCNL